MTGHEAGHATGQEQTLALAKLNWITNRILELGHSRACTREKSVGYDRVDNKKP